MLHLSILYSSKDIISQCFFVKQELEQFLENTTDGVVVFSLGSYVNVIPRSVQHVIIEAFSLLPYQVFFKFENKENITLPPNVKALKWLPQNDLLGKYFQ